jgi:hypothetical protein
MLWSSEENSPAWLRLRRLHLLEVETVCKLGTVDTKTHSMLLLETLATCSLAHSELAGNERPAKTGDPARQESHGSLAYGQYDREWCRNHECLLNVTRRFEHEDFMGRTCSSSLDRRMRTLSYGSIVGRVSGNGHTCPTYGAIVAFVGTLTTTSASTSAEGASVSSQLCANTEINASNGLSDCMLPVPGRPWTVLTTITVSGGRLLIKQYD